MSEVPASQMRQAPDKLIGTLVADKYRIISLIARGGMGRIYRAEQMPLGRVVALKILTPRGNAEEFDPQLQKRFLLEAATCARLTHPNTVTVFDYGAADACPGATRILAPGAHCNIVMSVAGYTSAGTVTGRLLVHGLALDGAGLARVGYGELVQIIN